MIEKYFLLGYPISTSTQKTVSKLIFKKRNTTKIELFFVKENISVQTGPNIQPKSIWRFTTKLN